MGKGKQAQLKGKKKERTGGRNKNVGGEVGVGLGEFAQEPQAKVTKPVVEGVMPKLPPLPRAAGSRKRKPKPLNPCTCGCGGTTQSMWVPGHDARAKGWAQRIERDICKLSDVPANERKGAEYMLKARKDLAKTNLKLAPKPEAAAAVNE